MAETLHIVEPTLESEAGHCHSFVSSLCHAAKNATITIWCGRGARVSLPDNVRIKRYFYRKLRKFQAFCLYRRLLKEQGRLFISTAGRTDIVLLNLASRCKIEPRKAFLYIHWFKASVRKSSQLRKLAVKQPNITILAPTRSICEEFQASGFSHVREVPYPITPKALNAAGSQQFQRLLFAGAARRDKGFGDVVNLVALLATRGEQMPISLQATPEHYGKFEDAIQQDLERLKTIAYASLDLREETLTQDQYNNLFVGAICLQLYSRPDFADRISGVTLDALSAGSPVITLSGTWIARVVAEFDAGAVIDSSAPETVLNAAKDIKNRYPFYRDNALKAGVALQERNSAGHLFRELMS